MALITLTDNTAENIGDGLYAIVGEIASGNAASIAIYLRRNSNDYPVTDATGTAITLTQTTPTAEVRILPDYQIETVRTGGSAAVVTATRVTA